MPVEIIVLGAGFGGLEASTGLKRELGDDVSVTLFDKRSYFMPGFSKYDLVFGRENNIRRGQYSDLKKQGITFFQETISAIKPDSKIVMTDRRTLAYDYLIIALGAEVHPELTPGLVQGGYEFYTPEGAAHLHQALEAFTGGSILISILGMPYKCPPAPYEMAFLLDSFFTKKGLREKVTLKVLSPGGKALPVAPAPSQAIEQMMAERGIEFMPKHLVTALDPASKQATLDGRDPMPYDMFIGVPIHKVPRVMWNSALDAKGWVKVDQSTLRTEFEGVYAIGDVTNIPVGELALPKAGVFAEEAAKIVTADLVNRIRQSSATVHYDAIGGCFVDLGTGETGMLESNFFGGAAPDVQFVRYAETPESMKDTFVSERYSRWFGK
jgi:sulfide:quinone oxidoreductase